MKKILVVKPLAADCELEVSQVGSVFDWTLFWFDSDGEIVNYRYADHVCPTLEQALVGGMEAYALRPT